MRKQIETDRVSVQEDRHSVVICVMDHEKYLGPLSFNRLLDARFADARLSLVSYLRNVKGFTNV